MRQLTRRSPARSAGRGLTLIELMMALVVGAILLATAAPYFSDYITNSRLRENGNMLLAEALIAQSEAIKRNGQVRLSTTAGGLVQVTDLSVMPNVVLRERQSHAGISMTAVNVTFGASGRPVPLGTTAAVDVTSALATCSSETRCPGLRIDAGGAVRLCGNHLACP